MKAVRFLVLFLLAACLCGAGIITVPVGQPNIDIQLPYPLVNGTALVPAVVQESAPQYNVAIGGSIIYYLDVFRPADLVIPTSILGPTPPQVPPLPVAYIVNVLTPTYQPPPPPLPQSPISTPPTDGNTVPEPGTLAMAAIGLLLIYSRVRS